MIAVTADEVVTNNQIIVQAVLDMDAARSDEWCLYEGSHNWNMETAELRVSPIGLE